MVVTETQAVWIGLVAIVFGGLLGLLVGWLVRQSERRHQMVNRAADILEEEDKIELQWKTLYLEECRKREEQFRMIQGIQKERDHWKDIFWQCSGEHGVAQEYMVRVNQHFAHILHRSPDHKMAEIWRAFKEKYGEAAKPEIAERISRGAPGVAGPVPLAAELAGGAQNTETGAVVVAKADPNA